MYTWHMISRWYTSDLLPFTVYIENLLLKWYQGLYLGVEEIGAKCLQPGSNSLLHVGVGLQIACQPVSFKWFKAVK
jgi:hypothetical protein